MFVKILKDNLLIVFLIFGVTIGVILGIYLRGVWTFEDYRKIFYLEFPGRILMNILKSLMLPLVISSLISGISSIGSHASGKLGAAAILYYLFTTLIAVSIGIVLVILVHPGHKSSSSRTTRNVTITKTTPIDSILDLISQCFPDNFVSACFERAVTEIVKVKSQPRQNETGNNTYTVDLDKPRIVSQDGINVLGIVVASIALGCVINIIGEDGQPLKVFFHSLDCVSMILIKAVICMYITYLIAIIYRYTPIGIIFFVASKLISTRGSTEIINCLAMYMVVILSGLAIHGLIVLPIIYYALTRKNPARFGFNMMKALFTAWGTSSSSAALPITMDCLIKKNHVDVDIVRFVVPVGTIVNKGGTALYEVVACIFIAQVNDMSLSIFDVIIISLTATAASIGAAGIPHAGIITLVIVLTAVGLPIDDITLILPVDWFLTTINVCGDSVGAGILDHYFSTNLTKPDHSGVSTEEHNNSVEAFINKRSIINSDNSEGENNSQDKEEHNWETNV